MDAFTRLHKLAPRNLASNTAAMSAASRQSRVAAGLARNTTGSLCGIETAIGKLEGEGVKPVKPGQATATKAPAGAKSGSHAGIYAGVAGAAAGAPVGALSL